MIGKRLRSVVFAAGLTALLVIGTASPAAAVDITGHWKGSNGVEYDIIQMGNTFEWKVPATGEIGVGTINGMDCSAGWPFGFATGHIIANPSGAAVEINWSNGVFFQRPAPGGGSGGLAYTFGPNPAWSGATVWVKLSLPVAHEIRVWHNGQIMPITKFVNNNEVEVTLPTKVTSGPLRVEYQGKRLEANQPNRDIEIKPIDISGQWKWAMPGITDVSIKQNGAMFTITFAGPGKPATTYNGDIVDGNIARYHTATDYKDCKITRIDPSGRALEMKRTDSSPPMTR